MSECLLYYIKDGLTRYICFFWSHSIWFSILLDDLITKGKSFVEKFVVMILLFFSSEIVTNYPLYSSQIMYISQPNQ